MYAGKTVCSWYDAADPPEDTSGWYLVWVSINDGFIKQESYGIARYYGNGNWHTASTFGQFDAASGDEPIDGKSVVTNWRPLPLSPPQNRLLDTRRNFCKTQNLKRCGPKCPLYNMRDGKAKCSDAVLESPYLAEMIMNGDKKDAGPKDAIHTKNERRHNSRAGKHSEMQSNELERLGTLKE